MSDAVKPDAPLSEKELFVARGLADGLSRRELAAQLRVGVPRVDQHAAQLIAKTDATCITHAIATLFRRGLLS